MKCLWQLVLSVSLCVSILNVIVFGLKRVKKVTITDVSKRKHSHLFSTELSEADVEADPFQKKALAQYMDEIKALQGTAELVDRLCES